jgi:hypothetical protein
VKIAIVVGLLAGTAGAQTQCQVFLANHSGTSQGLTLSLEGHSKSAAPCALSSVIMKFAVGDGTGFTRVTSPAEAWQRRLERTARPFFVFIRERKP